METPTSLPATPEILVRVDVPMQNDVALVLLLEDKRGIVLRTVDLAKRSFLIPRYPAKREQLEALTVRLRGENRESQSFRHPRYDPDLRIFIDPYVFEVQHGRAKVDGSILRLREGIGWFLEECDRVAVRPMP